MLIDPMKTQDVDPSLKPFMEASTLANMVCHGLGRRPETLRQWFSFYNELTRADGSISMNEKELIRHQIASLYNCKLCTSFIHPSEVPLEVTLEKAAKVLEPDDGFSEKEKAMLDFSRKVFRGPQFLQPDDFERMRRHFSEEQITEIGFLAAMFTGWGRLTFGFRVVDQNSVGRYEVPGSFDQGVAALQIEGECCNSTLE